ncbi:aspartate dehydrogenase domain-containing protein [Psychromicrobium xiongbiense]|uniref:aspartate dehydrogenase domain-containing protein n=1 Tax=Psychromicrobium xiongbiense TaxID=3051184 RepID=UPI002552C8C5|nr:aspartate dehydrogenase domain-containing protein [Psychromicrobium sp. YIM S02556]
MSPVDRGEEPERPADLRVAIIGRGAVSAHLQTLFSPGDGLRLIGLVGRSDVPIPQGDGLAAAGPASLLSFEEALECSDVVVEAAGVQAVHEFGPRTVAAGRTLLVSSVGALADPDLATALGNGPGWLHPSTGAIGGLDLIRAASLTGGIQRVSLRTRKLPKALIQQWMNEAEQRELLDTVEPRRLFHGTPQEAVRLFPASLNVAVALGLAVGSLDRVEVELWADPGAGITEHLIQASGAAGDYEFRIRNTPNPAQPRSSGLTARALYSGLIDLATPSGRFR